jgi:hypothetical protein
MSTETAKTDAWGTRILKTAPVIGALFTAIGTLIASVLGFQGSIDDQTSMKREQEIKKEISVALSGIETKLKKIDAISMRVDSITKLPQGTQAADKIDQLNKKIESLNDRLASLEQYLVESPDKALALPLFQKELDSLKDSVRSARVNTNSEIARIYDQNKWFIGLMFTMAVSVIGLAISNLYQGRKVDDKE